MSGAREGGTVAVGVATAAGSRGTLCVLAAVLATQVWYQGSRQEIRPLRRGCGRITVNGRSTS